MNFKKNTSGELPSNTSKMPYIIGAIVAVLVLAALFIVPMFTGDKEGTDTEGTATSEKKGTPSIVTGALTAAGDGFVCYADGSEITCLGQNSRAQLGDYSNQDTHSNSFSLSGDVVSLVAGKDFACATSGQGLTCWGDNRWKQAGDLDDIALEPTEVPTFKNKTVSSISAGENFACALVEDEIYCWGADNAAQLGSGVQGSDANGIKRVSLPEGVKPVRLISSGFSTFFETDKGEWYGFGANQEGRISSDAVPYLPPTPVGQSTGQSMTDDAHANE
ncbi:MAG: hypothetical protein IKZ87_02540 [Actinomycetaceae bacterium]|nr:hypothetical protein [Actinomycetaceae bacterium]